MGRAKTGNNHPRRLARLGRGQFAFAQAVAGIMPNPALRAERVMDIKEIIKDNEVRFLRYRQGNAYYAVRVPSEGLDFMFPVPLADIGDATFHATEKAIVFMRYIRKAIDDRTFVKVGEGAR
jgi:hypothetical protein